MRIKAGAFLVLLTLSFGITAPAVADVWDDVKAAKRYGDRQTVIALLHPLAERGDARAQAELGETYQQMENDAEALKWLRKAEKQGSPAAQNSLGVMYLKGYGVPKDPVESVKWFRKAADQGQPAAQYNLGRAYKLGEGVPQDAVEAYRWYDLAATNQASTDLSREGAAQIRDELAAKMTPEQLAQVRKPSP